MSSSKIKKIIISSYDDLKNPVYAGGGAVSVHQLAKRLKDKYEIEIISGTFRNAKNEIIDGIKFRRIGSDLLGHKIGQLIYQVQLINSLKKADFDLWIESTTPPFTFSLLPLFTKKPVISWVNMLCSYDMKRKYFIDLSLPEKLLSKLYKYFVVPTQWAKEEIKKLNNGSKIVDIGYGFEESVLKQTGSKLNKKYFLFLGRVEVDQKGLDLLIESMAGTKDSLNMIIAGSGSKKEEKKLKALIAKYDLWDRIELEGKVTGRKKGELLSNALAVIVPSRFETFGIVALEALVYQKPLICFDIPQMKWVPEKYAYKIKPFEVKKLTQAIETLSSPGGENDRPQGNQGIH